MNLYPYQRELVSNLSRELKTNRAVLAVLGCGGGKSVIAADIALQATVKRKRILFLVHVRELLEQIQATFVRCGVDVSLCDFQMIQTYRRHLQPADYYQLIIIDEAHLFAAAYKSIIEHHANTYIVGFTATPIRLTKGGLGDMYSSLVQSVTTQWLIENNYLSPYKYYSVPLADTQNLKIKAGEYVHKDVAELMESKLIYGDTITNWERLAAGKKTIVYCASVEASQCTAEAFTSKGYTAIALDGKTANTERELAVKRFRAGEVQILCNCELFGVGFDIPDCECVILLRPTQSLSVFIQQSMRSMRYMPDKTALIIDHVGNVYQHGLPDDNREWTLETEKNKTLEHSVLIRECPMCYAVMLAPASVCDFCNAPLTKEKEKKGKKLVEIDLVEVARQNELKNTPLHEVVLDSWDSIVEYQKLKKYKFVWCLRYAKQHRVDIPSKYNAMCYRLKI